MSESATTQTVPVSKARPAAPAPAPIPMSPNEDGRRLISRIYSTIQSQVSAAESAFSNPAATLVEQERSAGTLRTARHLVVKLRRSLDHDVAPELSASLDRLYEYVLSELSGFDVDQDVTHLATVADIFATLIEAWDEGLGQP